MKRTTLIILNIIVITTVFFVVSLCSSVLSAQVVTAPQKVNVFEPIVVKAEVTKDSICLWKVSKPAKFISLDSGKTLHIWAPPGKHEIEVTIITVDWENKTVDAKQEVVIVEVVGQNPPIPPTPTDPLNFILLLEESAERTVQMGRILNSQKLITWLKNQTLTLNVVDDDVVNAQNQVPEQLKPYLMLNDKRPLLILDSDKDGINGVLFAGDFPNDVDQLIQLLEKYAKK